MNEDPGAAGVIRKSWNKAGRMNEGSVVEVFPARCRTNEVSTGDILLKRRDRGHTV
jgi:hypothetical protein